MKLKYNTIATLALLIAGTTTSCSHKRTIDRDGDRPGKDDVEAAVDSAVAISEDVVDVEEEVIEAPSIMTSLQPGEYTLNGKVANQNFQMVFQVNQYGDISGAYHYDKNPTNNSMRLTGTYNTGTGIAYIDEYFNDNCTGSWELTVEGNYMSGHMINYKGNRYDVIMEIDNYVPFD